MQTIIVDMTPGFRMPTIYYSQGDVGTQFAIDLRSRFGDSFPTGTTVTIQATKPSGFGFSVAATSVTNGVATFTTTAEMTDEFGRFPAELKVTKTGLTLFTANFYMDGERNTHPEGTTDGSQETVIPELTQLVERVEDAASSVLDMTVNATTLAAGSQATYSYDEETNTATFGIPKGADGSLASGVLAPTYSSSSTYAVGDYVYYSGSLYRCTTAITTAEAWTSGHWTQVALAPEVSDLKSELNSVSMDGVLPLSEYNTVPYWQLGGINGTSGQNENNSIQCRLRVEHALYAEKDCVIKNKSTDFYLFIYKYSDSACTTCLGELSSYLGTTLTSIALPKGYYYRFKAQMNPYVSMNDTVMASLIAKIAIEEDTMVAEHNAKISTLEGIVSAHSTSISDLEDKYYLEYGINRNPNNDEVGWIDSDGSIKTTGTYWHTDYCYVGDLDEVICSCSAVGGTVRYAQDMAFLSTYDENKNFIERVYTTGSSTYTVEDGVAFVRFCTAPSLIENVMLQGGDVFAPSFIPYVAPQQKLKPQYYNSGSNWSDKKWVAVGDSITEYNSKADKHYHDYVNEATGINVVNMGSSGTGYKRTEDESKAFYQRILNAPTDADVVTIFGSGNDLNYSAMGFSTFAEALGSPTDSGTSTICGCINQTIANLYSIMPTVQLGIVTPNPWETMNPANVGNDMDLYSNAIVEICKRHGIPCLDLYHCSNMRPWDATYRTLCYSNDGGYGVHPNDLGHKILASHFKAFLDTLLI